MAKELKYGKGETPLYLQIFEDLKKKIENNTWPVGKILPGENELMSQYGVSRITARQAVSLLESKGLVKRERGIGTTVIARKSIQENLTCIKSFTHEMEERGIKPSTSFASISRITADSGMAEKLGCDKGDPLYLIERVRLADGLPIVVFRTLVSAALPFPQDDSLYYGSLYELMKKHHIALPSYVRETFRAMTADAKLAKQLEIKKGDAILLRERKSYDPSGKQFGYTASYYAGDRYSYSIILQQ
jgi:GntR family transcriptional regulator